MLHGMESMHQQIIPGLPDDLGIRCLAMLSHGYHGVMETVSKRWRDVIRSEEYANCKAREGWCGDWIFVITERTPNQWIAYDPEADLWHPLPPTPCGALMDVLSCHCLYNKFLVIGGYWEYSRYTIKSNEMFQFDPFKKEWSRVTSMRTLRSGFASCTMDGKIYVAGGRSSDYQEGMNLAEVYDPLADKWEDLPPMPEPMMSNRGIAYKGKFYAINVYADDREGLRRQVQVFDPLSRSWHVKHGNWSPGWNQVVVADDQVYSTNVSGSTLERGDVEKDEWHIVGAVPPLYDSDGSQMNGARGYELASLGHQLYAMGGRGFMRKDLRLEDVVRLDRVRVCDPRCSPLIWRETRPMCRDASGYIHGWASLKQQ